MTANEPILDIALTFDSHFASLAGVTAASILAQGPGLPRIHFVHSGCADETLRSLDRLVSDGGGMACFYQADPTRFANLPVDKHASCANYYRLTLADILPQHIDRVIYLDCDLIVRKSLSPLFATPLDGFSVAVVPLASRTNIERLDLPAGTPYLSSGVLLIDLKEWRSRQIGSELVDTVRRAQVPIEYWDQDALALFFRGEWRSLPAEWNVDHRYFFGNQRLPMPSEEPRIVHFSGSGLKPWQEGVYHPYASEFWNHAACARRYGLKIPSPPQNKWKGLRQIVKTAVKRLVDFTLNNQTLSMSRPGRYIEGRISERIRQRIANEQIATKDEKKRTEVAFLVERVPNLTVQRGPFEGLRYPRAWSHGSSLVPKILGTYECELHPVFQRLMERHYDVIVDIGAAEGYYAVGAARAWPSAKIFAFERQEAPREFLMEMARVNGVEQRVDVRGEFFLTELRRIVPRRRGLLICDAEGAEREIFCESTLLQLLNNFDLVLETHDFIFPGIGKEMKSRLSTTHFIEEVCSVDDIFRPDQLVLPELKGLSNWEQIDFLAERRPAAMRWLYLESRDEVLRSLHRHQEDAAFALQSSK